MVPQFTSVPTNHAVRPLLPAPCPVTLPVLLTNIIPEQFPYPRILTDIDTSRTPTPPPGSRRTPTPAPPPRHPTPDTRDSSLTPMGSDDEGSDSSFTPKSSSSKITRPSGTNIQTVKSLFRDLYPDLTEEEQGKEYTAFRTRLDTLCARYLRASLAFSHQDKDEVYKVYKKMTETFEWLAEYELHWPVAVCLQGKLHNSAARSVDRSTRKVVSALTGVSPRRAGSKKLGKKRKA